MKTSFYTITSVSVVLIIAGLFFAVMPESSAAEARMLAQKCAHMEDAAACYEKEIPIALRARSIPEIFSTIREVRRLDSRYQFCHVLAHAIGRDAVMNDPAKWLDLIPLNPSDGLCSNGFIHGVIVGRFSNGVLDATTMEATIPDFARACEPRTTWNPSPLDQAMCYHGLGHLFMFITDADIRASLAICARVAESPTGDFLRVCREGVFMQIYQPLEPDDFQLLESLPEKPTAENYRRLCAAYERDEDEGACLREAWPFFREEIIVGTGLSSFCNGQPNSEEERMCYESATTIIGRQLLGDEEKIVTACDMLYEDYRSLCYVTTAQAVIEEDRGAGERALSLCARAEGSVAEECISTLASRARFIFGNAPERERFCAEMSEPHRAVCAQR